jgi:hypothetical protein
MNRLARILITGTALTILPLSLNCALAQNDDQGSEILNGQIDFGSSNSHINTTVKNTAGSVDIESVAGGNTVDIFTMDNTKVVNKQIAAGGNISSGVNADVQNTGGGVNISSSAFCNNASISTDPHLTQVYSYQECDTQDPSSYINANLQNIGSDATISSSAAGNVFEVDSNAGSMPIENNQVNNGNINSTVNATLTNINGNTVITSQAIGNSAQIIHY